MCCSRNTDGFLFEIIVLKFVISPPDLTPRKVFNDIRVQLNCHTALKRCITIYSCMLYWLNINQVEFNVLFHRLLYYFSVLLCEIILMLILDLSVDYHQHPGVSIFMYTNIYNIISEELCLFINPPSNVLVP